MLPFTLISLHPFSITLPPTRVSVSPVHVLGSWLLRKGKKKALVLSVDFRVIPSISTFGESPPALYTLDGGLLGSYEHLALSYLASDLLTGRL